MEMDDGIIIDKLYDRGFLGAGSIAAGLGDQIDEKAVTGKLEDMEERGLVEESNVAPGRWQLTEDGAAMGQERQP